MAFVNSGRKFLFSHYSPSFTLFGQKFSLSQHKTQQTRVMYELSKRPCLPWVLQNSEVIRTPGRHSGRSSNSVGARIVFFKHLKWQKSYFPFILHILQELLAIRSAHIVVMHLQLKIETMTSGLKTVHRVLREHGGTVTVSSQILMVFIYTANILNPGKGWSGTHGREQITLLNEQRWKSDRSKPKDGF